jgi:hypothetical protein
VEPKKSLIAGVQSDFQNVSNFVKKILLVFNSVLNMLWLGVIFTTLHFLFMQFGFPSNTVTSLQLLADCVTTV